MLRNLLFPTIPANTPDAGGGGPASPAPAGPDLPPSELSSDSLSAFVSLAEEGGLSDRDAGNMDFPDLPSTEAPAVVPSVSAPPVAPPVASPATPAVEPPAVASPAVAPAPPAQVTPPVQAPATPAAPVAPAVTPPVAQAAPTSVPQAEPAAAPAVAAAPAPVGDPFAALAAQITQQSEAYVGAIAEKLYPITQEDHEAFISGDTAKLSALAARIHFNSVNSVLNSISKLMPVMVNGLLQVRKKEEDYENEFWSANPHLDRMKHVEPVKQVLRTYNQLNPNTDQAKRFRDVGLLVAQMHNIPLQVQAPAGGQPAAPQAMPVRTPGPVVRQVEPPGFAPASAGGAPLAPQAPSPNGVWGDFVEFAAANERGLFDQQG